MESERPGAGAGGQPMPRQHVERRPTRAPSAIIIGKIAPPASCGAPLVLRLSLAALFTYGTRPHCHTHESGIGRKPARTRALGSINSQPAGVMDSRHVLSCTRPALDWPFTGLPAFTCLATACRWWPSAAARYTP